MLNSTATTLFIASALSLFLTGCGGGSGSSAPSFAGDPTQENPSVNLNTNLSTINKNDSVTLNWSSNDVDNCVAAGDWFGNKSTSGSETINALTADSTFLLNCSGTGGEAADTVTISVTDSSATVSATNKTDYIWSTLTTGSEVYIDRNYTYFRIPSAFEGFQVLKTANDDKTSSGDAFLSFNVDQAVTVYVAYHVDGGNLPVWLSSWSPTGNSLTTTVHNLELYRKNFTAGTITLGGNNNAQVGMYTVLITSSSTGAPAPPSVNLSASPTSVVTNGTTTLNWSSNNTDGCTASGDWSGVKATSGSEIISSITSDSAFNLSCSGSGGTANDSVNVSVAAPNAPTISMSLSAANVDHNGSTTINWTSTNAETCNASGDWSGTKSLSGSQTFNALTANSTFTLNCSAQVGSVSKTVNVTVAPPISPTITFSASPSSVSLNGSTTLSWSTSNADSCVASGDWSGNKNITGSQNISALTADSAFTLSCTGPGGTTNELLNVAVLLNNTGTALLSWLPPIENSDGSPLNDLSGYKIHYGTLPGKYNNSVTVNSPEITSYLVDNLPPALWYFAVTSLNSSGIESEYSTEVSKLIN